MFDNKDVVAIVPARGGSKGLLKKNIALLNGKPLIEYTLDLALNSSYIDKVIVSTDDLDIEKISINFGALIIRRPSILATDNASTLDTIRHSIEKTASINDKTIIIVLQPTSPLREQRHIIDALELFTNNFTSVVSVCEAEHTPYKMYKINDERLVDFVSQDWRGIPRQKIPKVFRENGSIYVTSAYHIMKLNSLRGDKPRPYIMENHFSIDIDTKNDISLLEFMLKT
jgi:CMP-N,N'-diacetyllegionaminic acid synthase